MAQYENEALAVRNLQRYLRQLSYHDGRITPPPIDGIFERDTEQALRDFQRTQNLPETGIADRDTWERLYDSYRASLGATATARSVSFFPHGDDLAVFKGSSAAFPIAVLQYMLRELSARYGGMERVAVNGIYDDATREAVRRFQEQNRLPASGMTDLATWNAIADQHNILLYGEG